MKTLILLRHAKSSWSTPDEEDFDRPLNPRGRKSAPVIGAWLAEKSVTPSFVAVSPSARTIETFERIKSATDILSEADVIRPQHLYLASPEVLLETTKAFPMECSTGMIIAHNPGISDYVIDLLSAEQHSHPSYQLLSMGFPTAACAILNFDCSSWREIKLGTASLNDYVTPKSLIVS